MVAPDLPGHGSDITPIAGLTLDDYADGLACTVAAQSEPVILVGHSLGGAVITQAAEYCPGDVHRLVYLAAYVPGDGESVADWALQDVDSLLSKFLEVDWSGSRLKIDRSGASDCFYGDCSKADGICEFRHKHQMEGTPDLCESGNFSISDTSASQYSGETV